MHATYARLLEAAHELRDWRTAAEVARGLTKGGFTVSDQTMTNWKSRGISFEGVLEACRIIGVRTEFLRAGQLPLPDATRGEPFGHIAMRAATLIDAMPEDEQVRILHYLQINRERQRHLTT